MRSTYSYSRTELLHVLRNPYDFSQTSQRLVRLQAADEIELLDKTIAAYEEIKDIDVKIIEQLEDTIDKHKEIDEINDRIITKFAGFVEGTP